MAANVTDSAADAVDAPTDADRHLDTRGFFRALDGLEVGDRVTVTTCDYDSLPFDQMDRTLTVEDRHEYGRDDPSSITLSGYGTSYLLTYQFDGNTAWLTWPSGRDYVEGVRVEQCAG